MEEAVKLQLRRVVKKAWLNPFALQSDFARQKAPFVAMAASMGFITTRTGENTWSTRWLVTPTGLVYLEI